MSELSPYITELFLSAFAGALAVFVFGTTLLTAYTWLNTRRLRNCMLSWKDPGLEGLPVFPAIFTILTVAAMGYHASVGESAYRWFEIAYLWAGVNWFLAYYLMSKRYITDYGIVKNINDPSQTIAWNQVNDYFEVSRQGYAEFTFFFTITSSDHLRSERIQLKVPHGEYEAFRRILTYKVDRNVLHSWSATSDMERFY